MTLSDNIETNVVMGYGDGCTFNSNEYDGEWIKVENVKQFIKEIRELLENCISGGCDSELIMNTFDKLAGDKLI